MGIIHRDLKPSNILVTPDGQPHVVDFGLARALEEGRDGLTVSLTGEVAGTPPFMSPEQAAGNLGAVDTRSDVYSLGAILYLLLTGRPPHDLSGSSRDVLHRVARGPIIRPRQASREIDGELEAILLKGLAPEPERRYAAAGALGDDIDRYLNGDPLTARAPTLAYWAGRCARKYRFPLAAAAMIGGALLAMAVYTHVRVTRERDVAEERLCDSLLAQADAMAGAQRFAEARPLYEEARQKLAEQHRSPLPAELGLLDTYRFAPPPLVRFVGHRGPVCDAAFSPDGQRVASASADGTVRIWDVLTGRPLQTFMACGGEARHILFCPDGRSVISASAKGTIQQWDLDQGRETMRIEAGGNVVNLACSPDGRLLALVANYRVVVRNLLTKSVREVDFELHNYQPTDELVFGPDSRTCFLVGPDFFSEFDAWTGKIRSSGTGLFMFEKPRGGRQPATSLDGRRWLAGSSGETRSQNLSLGEDVPNGNADLTFAGHLGGVSAVAFCPGGYHVVSAGVSDHAIRFWETRHGNQLRAIWGDAAGFAHAAFSPDTRAAISWGDDGVVRLWDLSDADILQTRVGSFGDIQAIAVAPDGRRVAIGGRVVDSVGLLAVWDVAAGQVLSNLSGRWGALEQLAFSPDGKWLVAGCLQGQVWLFRGDDGQPIGRIGSHDHRVSSVGFTPIGQLALSDDGNTLKAWRIPSGGMAWSSRGGATLGNGLGISPDGQTAFAETNQGYLFRYHISDNGAASPHWVQLEAHDPLEGRFVFLRRSSELVGSVGSKLMLWDIASGTLKCRFVGRPAEVTDVAVSPDERWVASGAVDGTITIWDRVTGREAHTFEAHASSVRHLAFAPSGDRLYSGDARGELRCWDFTRPKAYRDFAAKLAEASRVLQQSPNDPQALSTLANWYSFRHRDAWAAVLRAQIAAICRSRRAAGAARR